MTHHEVVVPGAHVRNHVEAHEAVAEQHLHLLVVSGQVAGRVARGITGSAPPLVAARGELVCCQATRAGREAACDRNAALSVPGLVGLWGSRFKSVLSALTLHVVSSPAIVCTQYT